MLTGNSSSTGDGPESSLPCKEKSTPKPGASIVTASNPQDARVAPVLTDGSLTGGGSSANLMGLAMAREAKVPANEMGAAPGIVYASTEVRMSIPKALALLGLGRQNLRLIPVDSEFRRFRVLKLWLSLRYHRLFAFGPRSRRIWIRHCWWQNWCSTSRGSNCWHRSPLVQCASDGETVTTTFDC